MADTSLGERIYIVQGIEQNVRTDGRSRSDYRPLEFETNVIAQADGSARLHLGSTDVLVGVKVGWSATDVKGLCMSLSCCTSSSTQYFAQYRSRPSHRLQASTSQVELGVPDSTTPSQGQVFVTVECSSCASPEFKV